VKVLFQKQTTALKIIEIDFV